MIVIILTDGPKQIANWNLDTVSKWAPESMLHDVSSRTEFKSFLGTVPMCPVMRISLSALKLKLADTNRNEALMHLAQRIFSASLTSKTSLHPKSHC